MGIVTAGKLSDMIIDSMKVRAILSEVTSWRNGSASDSRSEGCVFESRRGHNFFFFFFKKHAYNDVLTLYSCIIVHIQQVITFF